MCIYLFFILIVIFRTEYTHMYVCTSSVYANERKCTRIVLFDVFFQPGAVYQHIPATVHVIYNKGIVLYFLS